MNQAPDGEPKRTFSEEIDRLIVALRALLGGHWALLQAELGAIARDLIGTLIAGVIIIGLLLTALLGLFIALFLVIGSEIFGSMLWGAAHMTLALLMLAAWLASTTLRIQVRRRARSLLLGILIGSGAATLAIAVLHAALAPSVALGLTLLLAVLLVDLLIGLATFDMERFTDRFRPLASEAELRATAAALDDLRGEAAEGLATEMGSAFASAGAAVDATRGVVTKVADALKAAAERLRSDRSEQDV